jgi:hypothetical protein
MIVIQMTCFKNNKPINKTFKSEKAFNNWFNKNEGFISEVRTRQEEI